MKSIIFLFSFLVISISCSEADFDKKQNSKLNTEDPSEEPSQNRNDDILAEGEANGEEEGDDIAVDNGNENELICHWPISENKKTITINTLTSKNSCQILSSSDFTSQLEDSSLILDIENLKKEKVDTILQVDIECQDENSEIESLTVEVLIPKNLSDEKTRNICLNKSKADSKGNSGKNRK